MRNNNHALYSYSSSRSCICSVYRHVMFFIHDIERKSPVNYYVKTDWDLFLYYLEIGQQHLIVWLQKRIHQMNCVFN